VRGITSLPDGMLLSKMSSLSSSLYLVSPSLLSSIVFESDARVAQRVSLPCSNFVIPALNAPSLPSSSDVSKRLYYRSAPSTQNPSNNCFRTEVMMFQSIKRFESLPAIIKDLLPVFVIAAGEIKEYFFNSSQLKSFILNERGHPTLQPFVPSLPATICIQSTSGY